MKPELRRRLPLLLTIALLLLSLLALSQLQLRTRTVDTGPSAEARRNPWLAAEHFLQSRGLPVTGSEDLAASLHSTPAAGHTLLLLADQRQLPPPQHSQLLEWVAQGGHLVMVARSDWDEESQASGDWLLDTLQIRRLPRNPHQDSGESAEEGDAWPALTKLYLENEDAPAYFGFMPGWVLEDPEEKAQAWAGNAWGSQLLQLPLGDGLITVLSDDSIWSNRRIGQHDHAWLLWYLTQDSQVLLVRNLPAPGLLKLLQKHYPLTLGASALLIALLLWHFGLRHGPLQALPASAPRSLRDHLHAAAGFIARHAGHAPLLQQLQQEIRQRASRHYPDFERLPVTTQWQLLSSHSQLSPAQVREAMRPPGQQTLDATRFTRQVISLQRLRNAL